MKLSSVIPVAERLPGKPDRSVGRQPRAAGAGGRRSPLAAYRIRLPARPYYRYVRRRWRVLFTLVDAVGLAVLALMRLLLGWRTTTPHRDPRTILLVQLDHLGDAVLTAPMLPALRLHYPAARIEVLASAANAELFRLLPEVDLVHVCRRNRFARRPSLRWAWWLSILAWGFRLRRRGIDLAIDVRGEFPLALLLWLTGARRRLGWACGGGRFLLTDSPQYLPGRPETHSRAALIRCLGIPWDERRASRPLTPPAPAQAAIQARLAMLPSGLPRPLLVAHVGAGTSAKQWSVRSWRTLIAWLRQRRRCRVVLIGSEADRPTARRILRGLHDPSVLDWTGQLSLAESAALLAKADLFVGADSGPAHLAAAVGARVLALFSGTNRVRQWRPNGRKVSVLYAPPPCSPCHRTRCPLDHHLCMEGLRPMRVAMAIEQMLPGAGQVAPPRQLLEAVA